MTPKAMLAVRKESFRMPNHVVLLSPPADGRHLATALSLHNPRLVVTTVSTAVELEAAMAAAPQDVRLIAFFTGVVVSPAILERLTGPAYNFHPGPPAYPGKHPVAFALYDRAAHYGATAHEMTARTDSGPIVGTIEFPVPENMSAAWLRDQAYAATIRLFLILSRPIATLDDPLPHVRLTWGERRCSQRAFDAMRDLPPTLDREEFERRVAAFNAETGNGAPFVTLHGRRFVLEG